MTALHWSFDYDDHHAPGKSFRGELLACIESISSTAKVGKQHYSVLPNYWNGYSREAAALAFGTVELDREAAGTGFRYCVSYSNEAAGEDLHLHFETTSSACRVVTGEWMLRATNRAGDLYKSIETKGAIVGNAVQLCINKRLTLSAGDLPAGEPLTCNWSLFDCLSELVEEGIDAFNMLEDLEKLKPGYRIQSVDDTIVADRQLRGYVLHSPKDPPAYWWLDAAGRVAIASNVFNTFVLTEAG